VAWKDACGSRNGQKRVRATFAAVSGAQLMARSRSDIKLFDILIESYREVGLLPAWEFDKHCALGREWLPILALSLSNQRS